jgi:hypothetical protein
MLLAEHIGKSTKRHDHKQRGADTHQHMGPEAGDPIEALAFDTDDTTSHGRHHQPENDLMLCKHGYVPPRVHMDGYCGVTNPAMRAASPLPRTLRCDAAPPQNGPRASWVSGRCFCLAAERQAVHDRPTCPAPHASLWSARPAGVVHHLVQGGTPSPLIYRSPWRVQRPRDLMHAGAGMAA